MKIKTIIILSLLAATWLIWSCETTLDEDWSGFGSTVHFPAPYEGDHVGYLNADPAALTGCQSCHGADYDGGTSGVSCLACHESNGVSFDCNQCHGNASGDPDDPLNWVPQDDEDPHLTHLTGGDNSKSVDCNTCHEIPESWLSAGHLDGPPAEIAFSGLAQWRDTHPLWDTDEESCSSTYCHGEGTPEWEEDDLDCDSCHGLPPGGLHPEAAINECYECHDQVMDETGTIINPVLHLNGTINE
ncbi:CxxxxCH/CxxCH domain-containing protein [bacterium]|nr:CxxxxCH/CxxCH domain-containing protein [bacterium]MBU1880647.1 CxxxxCH/CxxCH domain-containing protein [bacterium]